MKTTLLFEMHHIKNNLVNITRTINTKTAEGREILTALATLHDQINNITDYLKAI